MNSNMINNFKYDFMTKRKKIATAGFLLLLTAVLLFFINAYAQGQFHSLDSLRNFIKGFGIMAPAVLILLQAAQVVLPVLPGFLGCAVGALLFGSFGGFWYNYIGISIGSIIAFFLARQYGIGLVKALFTNKQYEKWSARFGDSKRKPAILCLMISGLCDMFDGSIAATKQRNQMEKQFGIQIDSLSDLIAFGILPALFVYFIHPGSFLNMLASCTYTLCALIRLAYFNVVEEKRQNSCTETRIEYDGLPVTSISLILPAVYILQKIWPGLTPGIFTALLFIMAVLFISPVKIKKPEIKGKIGLIAAGIIVIINILLEVPG